MVIVTANLFLVHLGGGVGALFHETSLIHDTSHIWFPEQSLLLSTLKTFVQKNQFKVTLEICHRANICNAEVAIILQCMDLSLWWDKLNKWNKIRLLSSY